MVKFCLYIIVLFLSTNSCVFKASYNTRDEIKSGLYCNGDLFVSVYDTIAYTEYFIGSLETTVTLRVAFKDVLIRQNDSLFTGDRFLLSVKNNKIFLDAKQNPKNQFPLKLKTANAEAKRNWDKWHNMLILQNIKNEYYNVLKNKSNKSEKEKIINAYRNLKAKIEIDQLTFLKTVDKFKSEFLQN